jgi:hypothetical protein
MADETEIVREREIEAIFESERQACLAEVGDPAAEAEMRLWEATLEDGIDFDQPSQAPASDQSKQ